MRLVDERLQTFTERLDKIEVIFQQVAGKMASQPAAASSRETAPPQNAQQMDEIKKSMEDVKTLLSGIRDGGEDVLASLNSKMDVIQKVIVNLASDVDAEKVR